MLQGDFPSFTMTSAVENADTAGCFISAECLGCQIAHSYIKFEAPQVGLSRAAFTAALYQVSTSPLRSNMANAVAPSWVRAVVSHQNELLRSAALTLYMVHEQKIGLGDQMLVNTYVPTFKGVQSTPLRTSYPSRAYATINFERVPTTNQMYQEALYPGLTGVVSQG